MRELVERALVGTGASTELPATWPEVDGLFAAQADLSPERKLLLTAGAATVYSRAGRLPATVAEVPAPAPAETWRVCSPRARDSLATLLRGEFDGVWPEALTLLASAKQRVPFDLLPELLEKLPAHVRAQARPALGERGRWLAKLKPEWSWVLAADESQGTLPPDADRVWAEGSRTERRALFRLARAVDAERARAWLAASWKEEPAEVRVELAEAHAIGLSAADEPFLTQALSDRSSGVKLAVARLLWRLPESELAKRMRERAESYLQKSGKSLAVTLPPEKFEKAWEKEGLVESPPYKVGRRQWWLLQTIAAVSPSHWEQHFGMKPEELLKAALKTEHADLLLDAWTFAALRDELGDWMEPLWGVLSGRSTHFALSEAPISSLFARLPASVRDGAAVGMLRGRKLDASLLGMMPTPWPVSVADAFFSAVGGASVQSMYSDGLMHLLQTAAIAVPRAYLNRALTLSTSDEKIADWTRQMVERAVDSFHSALQFRRILHEEISP